MSCAWEQQEPHVELKYLRIETSAYAACICPSLWWNLKLSSWEFNWMCTEKSTVFWSHYTLNNSNYSSRLESCRVAQLMQIQLSRTFWLGRWQASDKFLWVSAVGLHNEIKRKRTQKARNKVFTFLLSVFLLSQQWMRVSAAFNWQTHHLYRPRSRLMHQ